MCRFDDIAFAVALAFEGYSFLLDAGVGVVVYNPDEWYTSREQTGTSAYECAVAGINPPTETYARREENLCTGIVTNLNIVASSYRSGIELLVYGRSTENQWDVGTQTIR